MSPVYFFCDRRPSRSSGTVALQKDSGRWFSRPRTLPPVPPARRLTMNDSVPCKDGGFQWVRIPPGNWSLQPEAVGAGRGGNESH